MLLGFIQIRLYFIIFKFEGLSKHPFDRKEHLLITS